MNLNLIDAQGNIRQPYRLRWSLGIFDRIVSQFIGENSSLLHFSDFIHRSVLNTKSEKCFGVRRPDAAFGMTGS